MHMLTCSQILKLHFVGQPLAVSLLVIILTCQIMGNAPSSAIVGVAAATFSALGAIRGRRIEDNPTMISIDEQLRRAEAEQEESLRLTDQLEKEKQELADKAAKQRETAERAAQAVEELKKKKQQQLDDIRKEREAARRATQMADEMKEQIRKKDEEMRRILDAQKELEAKWKKGIHPVEWPSREQYEENKRRFYKEGKIHLAITGSSGSGKSSLVNAVRGLWDDDEGAASTDVVETTSVVTPYPDPDPANPFIWFDVPGAGTLACPDWTYFNDQGLYIFDAIIILFNDCFTATDLAVLQNCARYMIPAYIVRTKSDVHVANLVSKKQRNAGRKADLSKITMEARKEYVATSQKTVNLNLAKNDPPLPLQKVYAVSRDTLTHIVRRESEDLEDCIVLDEHELLRDVLQDAYWRRSMKSIPLHPRSRKEDPILL
ncbi:interferon-inducible GTPase-domain-containing protein [Desarmillaria tabescens]|uniref:Interferon-inducible GTPase-domain-containing protein n=1 Tax=Armillaria tabescens TaxID=1929756 RepID=A0AA39NBG0_ARMTA|nr:interferon-inducible GTPase-domain-containing protein [Desarmillaria tabescens]KAK0462469.1 interferon-inducible GTPase-domain-containing protein [Desarmillaria tabescens]